MRQCTYHIPKVSIAADLWNVPRFFYPFVQDTQGQKMFCPLIICAGQKIFCPYIKTCSFFSPISRAETFSTPTGDSLIINN